MAKARTDRQASASWCQPLVRPIKVSRSAGVFPWPAPADGSGAARKRSSGGANLDGSVDTVVTRRRLNLRKPCPAGSKIGHLAGRSIRRRSWLDLGQCDEGRSGSGYSPMVREGRWRILNLQADWAIRRLSKHAPCRYSPARPSVSSTRTMPDNQGASRGWRHLFGQASVWRDGQASTCPHWRSRAFSPDLADVAGHAGPREMQKVWPRGFVAIDFRGDAL